MTELENTEDLVLLSTALDKMEIPSVVTNNNRLSHQVLVRPSDTGRRKVVSNARMIQFFEDAVAGSKLPDMIYLENLADLRMKTWCDVLTVPNRENGANETISFLIERDSGKTIARTYMSWNAKVIQDGH